MGPAGASEGWRGRRAVVVVVVVGGGEGAGGVPKGGGSLRQRSRREASVGGAGAGATGARASGWRRVAEWVPTKPPPILFFDLQQVKNPHILCWPRDPVQHAQRCVVRLRHPDSARCTLFFLETRHLFDSLVGLRTLRKKRHLVLAATKQTLMPDALLGS